MVFEYICCSAKSHIYSIGYYIPMKDNTKRILFINTSNIPLDPPCSAIETLPEWYKNTSSYIDNSPFPINGDNSTRGTIKKCIPVLDSLSLGYIIKTHKDIWVSRENNCNVYHWKGEKVIEFQARNQAPNHPNIDHPQDIAKFLNPWSIQTPKGYSCLFVAPMHRDTPIQILPGVVDTDSYNNPVNLPFVLKNNWFEGLIPEGTPVAQVIPFKRDDWNIELSDSKELIEEIKKQGAKIESKFYNAYKQWFWSRKNYR